MLIQSSKFIAFAILLAASTAAYSQDDDIQPAEEPAAAEELKPTPAPSPAPAPTPKPAPIPVAAKPVAKAMPAEYGSAMHITYGSPSWNTDSRTIDDASIFMRDGKTGKIVQIQLEETAPDSGQFSGRFNVNIGDKIAPEIYVSPEEIRGTPESTAKVIQMIQANQIASKPLVWKKTEKGQTLLDVYDTSEQSSAARKAYDLESRLGKQVREAKPLISEATKAAARLAERKSLMAKLALEAAKRETDRVRLEQMERQRAEERARQMRELSELERQERKARAQKIAKEALALYIKGKFKAAEQKFKQAVDLDPENKSYYYQYGVTLYRNNKFNEALVILKLAQVEPNLQTEKKYYMGLIHYSLKEYKQALSVFREVSKSGDSNLGPTAAFYEGIILYSQEKYEPAKERFEFVLDNSQDPKLDQQSEEYIERIANALIYKKMAEQKWMLTGTVGVMYDSNVLLTSDTATDQGSASDKADSRILTVADVEYRPVFTEHNEWSAKATATLINSAKTENAVADPFLYTFAFPYSYKGTVWTKGYKFTLKPGYEILYMDPNATGTKELIEKSYFFTFDNTFVMSKTWFATYSLEYRGDDFTDATNTGVNDADAAKIALKTTQTFLGDKRRIYLANFGVTNNAAKGDEVKFMRYDLGFTYLHPVWKESSVILGLGYYSLKYPDAAQERADTDYAFTAGLNVPVKDWVTWNVTGTFTKNDSNIPATYEYSKYTIMTTATFMAGF